MMESYVEVASVAGNACIWELETLELQHIIVLH